MPSFLVSALDADRFRHLYGQSDAALAALGVIRSSATSATGFPCRITLEDAALGESVLLLNHEHLAVDSPFRSRHAIYIREGAERRRVAADAIPDQLRRRLLSVRAYDEAGMLRDGDICEGTVIEPLIDRLFAAPEVAYLHVHNARLGCYLARIDRA